MVEVLGISFISGYLVACFVMFIMDKVKWKRYNVDLEMIATIKGWRIP